MHFACLAITLLKDEESARDNHGLACNFAPILFFFTRRQNYGHESVAPLFLAHPVLSWSQDYRGNNAPDIGTMEMTHV